MTVRHDAGGPASLHFPLSLPTPTMTLQTKLPKVGTTIFTVMSQLAMEHDAVNLGQGFPTSTCPNG